jgi:hypothetical protein
MWTARVIDASSVRVSCSVSLAHAAPRPKRQRPLTSTIKVRKYVFFQAAFVLHCIFTHGKAFL